MIRFFTLAILSFSLSSCFTAFNTQVDYLGNSFAPTRHVDVYVDAGAIKKPYTVIGKGYVNDYAYNVTFLEKLQESVVEKAKAKGADAVLFQEFFLLRDESTSVVTTRSDSTGRTIVRNTSAGPVMNTRREILFLKYE